MKKSNPQCSLLICSCDAYIDLLDPFFTLFKRYWPNCRYNIILSTESTDYSFPGLKIINVHPTNSDCAWTDRVMDAAKKINTDQIIFMLDDFFLVSKVDDKKITQIVEWLANDKKIATFTLWNTSGKNKNSKYPGFSLREKDAPYKVTAIAGIWNKKWLLKYLKHHESAWKFERNANIRSKKMLFPGKFYIMKDAPKTIFPYDFNNIGLYSGKWMKDTEKIFKAENISIDFKQRGWYNPKYSSFNSSRSSCLDTKSSIFSFSSRYKPIRKTMSNTPVAPGEFKQKYVFRGKNFFKWVITDIPGFSISNLKIEITYSNGSKKNIDNKTLFGSFRRSGNKLIFNQYAPSVFVTTKNKLPFKKVIISGFISFPATKKELEESYLGFTPAISPQQRKLLSLFLAQSLTSRDLTANVRMDSVLKIDDEDAIKNIVDEGKFKLCYEIPPKASYAVFTPSRSAGYRIKNFNVYLYNNSGKKKKVVDFTGLPKKINNWLIFVDSHDIKFNIKGYSNVIITGKMKRSITPNQLKKML